MLPLGRSNARNYARDRAPQDRQLHDLNDRLRQVPAAFAEPADAVASKKIVIEGGNLAQIGNNIEGICYAAGPLTLSKAYDPNVDTVYPLGLGRGFLFLDGVQQAGFVLVRHNYYQYTIPLLQGYQAGTPGTTTLTFDPGGGGAVVSMTAYLLDWV